MLDELWSGVAVSGAPSIEREFALSHAGYVLFVFGSPLLVAAVLEGALALLSDLGGRRSLVVAGQAGLAASLVFVAWTRSVWGLTTGLAFAGMASGVACNAAQAILVTTDPRGSDRAMVRWSLFASTGDLLTPLVTAAAVTLGYSYRGTTLVVALAVAAQCAIAARGGPAGVGPDEAPNGAPTDPEPCADPLTDPVPDPFRRAITRAARRPRLWAWLSAAAICTLLDELVVALATLRLVREQRLGDALAVVAAITFSAGSLVGAALADRVVARWGDLRVLIASAIMCALSIGVDIELRSALGSCLALFAIGVTCAPHHALAQARAYDEMPANPGTVQAIGRLFTAIEIGAPIVLGLVADRFGLRAAIACLVLQPVVILFCCASASDRAAIGSSSARTHPPSDDAGG